MKEQNIKLEIHKVIDMLPDDISKDVLDYLKTILKKSSDEIRTSSNISKIINEDKNLLNRLAK